MRPKNPESIAAERKSAKTADRNQKGIHHIERGDCVMTAAEKHLIIDGLQEFMHGWCIDREEMDKCGEPAFRCTKCPFSDGSFCKIKQFVHNQFGAEAAYSISAMSR